MRGFAQDFEPAYSAPAPFDSQVVGVVCASEFPEPDLILETLRKGQAHDPGTVWVVRDKDRLAVAALEQLQVEYVALSLNPFWKVELPVQGPLERGKRRLMPRLLCDVRATVRASELIRCCSLVVVFAKPEPGALQPFVDAAEINPRVKVIVKGKPRSRARRSIPKGA